MITLIKGPISLQGRLSCHFLLKRWFLYYGIKMLRNTEKYIRLYSGAPCRQPSGLMLRFVTDVTTIQSPLLAMTPAATWLQKPCSADAETQRAVPAQACVSWLTRAHSTLNFSSCVVIPTLEKTGQRENRGSAAMDSLKTKCFLNISMWKCSCEFSRCA